MVFLLLVLTTPVAAQTLPIDGIIRDASTGTTLPGATVQVFSGADRVAGTIADRDGHYVLHVSGPGAYRLRASFVGYRPVEQTVVVTGAGLSVDLALSPSSTELQELVVESVAGRGGGYDAGVTSIRPRDLASVPMPDVTYDLAGYLQTRPGVVTTGDRGGQLFVRGGTPTQNLVLVDGIPIFQPFHIVGFYSAFPADNIAWVDVYAGGFPAQFGGRISSVIDIATGNGDKSRTRVSASMAPFLSGIRIETPVSKDRVSLVLSARESIIDRVAPTLLGQEMPFRFGDRFAKLHAFLTPTSTFSFTGLQTYDSGNLESTGSATTRRSTWKNDAYGARYFYMPPESAVTTELSTYYSRIRSRYRLTPTELRTSDIDDYALKINFSYLLGESHLHFGMFGNTHKFEFDVGTAQRAVTGAMTSGGGYMQARIGVNRTFRIEPGLRVEAFSRGRDMTWAPRLRMTWLPVSRHRFSAAWGVYHQQIVGLTNEQDVSDVFTTWAASPRNLPVPQATHLIVGWKGVLTRWLELSVEAYRKDLEHIAFPVFTRQVDEVAVFSSVEGRAEGLDVTVDVQTRRVAASVGYSLAGVAYHRPRQRSQSFFFAGGGIGFLEEARFRPPHDRRHQANAMIKWQVGAAAVSGRWQFGSGLPFTKVNGYYDSVTVTNPASDEHLTGNGTTFVSRAESFAARLPTYHRLDLSVEYRFRQAFGDVTLQGGVINAYDRANIFEYNIFSGDRVDQLPIIPSFGLRVDLK
ncbi:MAG: TonB-dependent receptor [Rhodothermales bacterium]